MKDFQMPGKRDSARLALQRSAGFLAPQHHDQILDALSSEGLLDEPKNAESGGRVRAAADLPKRQFMTPLQCSKARGGANLDLLKSVQARAARMGFRFEIDDKHIDVDAFNAAAKGGDISERLAIKACWHKLGLIA
jgi:hypothetical protein